MQSLILRYNIDMRRLLPYLLPQPRDILFIGVFFMMIYGGPKLFSNDGDLGRHITVGNYILDTISVPTHDLFSHTVYGAAFVPHEWLAQVMLAVAHRAMGLSGDVFLAALLAALTILLVYNEIIRRDCHRLVALLVTMLVIVVSSVHWLARPHMFTFFFITVWTYWLERVKCGEENRIWFFPLLMLMWANTHGAFFAGFVVWGTYVAEWLVEYWRGNKAHALGGQLAMIGFTSFLTTFITPSGWHLWTTTVGYIGNEFITSRIGDHVSPNFHEADMLPFLVMIVLAVLALAQERRLAIHDALLLAGWIAMGLHTVRNLPLFAVVTAPIYGMLFQGWAENNSFIKKILLTSSRADIVMHGYTWSVVAVLFFGVAWGRGVSMDQQGTGNIFLPDRMPVQAVNWLELNPQDGNVFNSFTWGGYMLYRMWPTTRVFIDGQVDVYGETIFRDYLDVMSMNNDWETILDKYNVQWMLIPTKEPLAQTLKADQIDPWNVIYEDQTSIILRREPAAP